MITNWLRKRRLKKQLSGDYNLTVDLSRSMPKVPQDWYCFVCGDYIATTKDTLMLCDKKSCARSMGLMEVRWELSQRLSKTDSQAEGSQNASGDPKRKTNT